MFYIIISRGGGPVFQGGFGSEATAVRSPTPGLVISISINISINIIISISIKNIKNIKNITITIGVPRAHGPRGGPMGS